MKRPGHKSVSSLVILLANVLLLAFATLLYGRYIAVYQERLREENLGNIANLNQSAATNATALIDSWSIKLDDLSLYIQRHDLSYWEALETLEDSNSSENRQFELIAGDYTGHLAKRGADGAYIPISYAGSSYAELQKLFDDVSDAGAGVRFAPEFTDGYTALKFFGVCTNLSLRDDAGRRRDYALLLATKAKDVLAVFNNQNVFDGLSSVLVDGAGYYIVSNNDFKSDNFFQYLYVYNDLTLDQRGAIQSEFLGRQNGELYYMDAKGRDCVFRYARMATNDWYCITCVPISSFRTPVFDINYALYAVMALLMMLGVDLLWLRGVNRRMRVSMLREKEASEAKTEFLSRMSHDIRTPLNGIIGLTTLAMDEKNPPKTAEYLDNIKVSGDFLLGLVNDVLDMSRVESGKMELYPEPYQSVDFIKYITAVFTPLCRDKGLRFQLTPPVNTSAALFDRLRLNQIFFNLLSNAVKYTPPGGSVSFTWTKRMLDDKRAAFDFVVSDDGIGMSAEFQKHMFDSFSQEHVDTMTHGAGLGLSIVWNLVRLMGGAIVVQSEPGAGTTFTVRLETDICEVKTPKPTLISDEALMGKLVLLCEDNGVNVMFAQGLLRKWGIRSEVALNGRLGVEMFEASEYGHYDAVLMDIRMPEMNGLDATRAIRAMDRPDAKSVPIIAMTANAYDTDVQNCLDAGMNAHLSKPIQPEKLHDQLAELL